MSRHRQPHGRTVTASLCDSRSCNQSGGGEYLKADIEDLFSLVPGTKSRVTLRTCFGLCNHSPNLELKTTGGRELRFRQGRLVNDGGFRMRVDDDADIPGEEDLCSVTDTAIISNATVEKVAEVIDLKMPHAVRAVQCKVEGNKFMRDGQYSEALQCYARGCEEMCSQHETDGDDFLPTAASLWASLWLCCVRSRLLWAPEIDGKAERIQLLQLAAGDAFRILSANDVGVEVTAESDSDTIHGVMTKLVHCSAGCETLAFSPSEIVLRYGREKSAPLTNVKILSELCVALADAWSGLADSTNNDAVFVNGALAAYRGAMVIASTSKVRIFRAKERRRIGKALVALSSS